MPGIIPVGPIKGVKALDAMGTGLPKQRGPQGPANLGDAGLPNGGGFQLPQMQAPQVQMPEIPGQDPERAVIESMQPQDRPGVDHPKSVNGWLKNLWEDVYSFGAAIPASFKVAAQSGAEIAKHWRYLDDIFINHPELIGRELDTTTRQVIKGLTDTYDHGLGEALYKHPFSVLLDLTGVFDLAGMGIKTAGKASLKMGASAENAARLAKLGASVQSMPGRILKSPFIKGVELLEKVPATQKVMQSYALSKLGREEAAALGKFQLNEKALLEPVAKELFKRKLSKKEWGLFDDLLDGMVPRSQIKNPKMLERYDEWMKHVIGDERVWGDLGIMTGEEMEKASLKQTALKLKERGHFKGELYKYEADAMTGETKIAGFTDEAYAAAKEWAGGKNPYGEAMRPVYKPFVHERSFNVSELLDALGAGEKSDAFRKWWGRMEQRTGMKPHTLDPDLWQARSMLQKAEIMGTVKYYDDAIRRHGKPIKVGGKAEPGYVVVPPMLQRYVKNGLPNAMDVLTQKATAAVERAKAVGGDRAQALKQGIKETHTELLARQEELLGDLKGAMENPAEYAVQVPKEVAYMMQKSMVGPKGAWKFYDNVLNTWRDAILTFMPRYYVNNLLGNAVMMMFAGHTPMNKVAALREADLPGEALSSMLGAEGGGASSYIARLGDAVAPGAHKAIRRFTNTLSDATDNRAKQVVLSTLSKEVIARDAELGNVVAGALQAQETAEKAASMIFQARREVIGTGLEELQQTKKAIRGSGGDFETLRQGIVGKKEYQINRPQIDPAKQSMADAVTKEMMEIQRKIQRERQLSNMSPGAADGRIAELESQLKLKASQLEQIDPNLTIAGQMGTKVTQMPEISKMAEIQARRVALQPYADLAEKTVLQMEKFFGNYGRLHPMEREYVRRVIPFWTFSKTMFKLAFNLPFLRPKTSFLWHQFSKLMMDSMGDDRLPNRYRNMVPVGGDEQGNIIFLKISGFNPLEQAGKMSSVGGIPIPQFLDPRNNPLVKMGVESIGGYDLFTEKPFTKPTDFVSMNGSVKRYDPDLQRIETIIPQKPIIDSLFQQIPHMKILAELVQSAGLSSDYLGVDTPRNPDGTLTYNRQWWHALMRAGGFPITTQNPEKVQMQHALLKRGMTKRFRSAAGRVDPETRVQLETILRDMDKAEVYE